MKRLIWIIIMLAMTWGCDGGGSGGGEGPGEDTTLDAVAGPETMEDTLPADTAEDAAPPADTVADLPPAPDTEPGEDTVEPMDTETPPVEIPDSPVGAQLEWFLGLFSGENPVSAGPLEEHFHELLFDGVSPGGYTYGFKNTVLSIGPMELLGFEDEVTTDYTIAARVFFTKDQVYGRCMLRTETAEPYKITSWTLYYAPDLDPDLGGPVAEDELGLYAFDPYFGGLVVGAEVEAVDRETGESFDPPVTTTTAEGYGWARMTLPAGVDEVGLRVTAPDGTVTRSYSGLAAPGRWNTMVPAFPAEALADYLETLEIVEEPGTGVLWGLVQWTDIDENPFIPPDPTVPDSYIGCAVLSFDPAGPQAMYSEANNGWPLPEATTTHPDYSTWWAYNVPDAPLTVTTTTDAGVVDVLIPMIEPGAITMVDHLFTPPEFATNPEPDGCEQGIE